MNQEGVARLHDHAYIVNYEKLDKSIIFLAENSEEMALAAWNAWLGNGVVCPAGSSLG